MRGAEMEVRHWVWACLLTAALIMLGGCGGRPTSTSEAISKPGTSAEKPEVANNSTAQNAVKQSTEPRQPTIQELTADPKGCVAAFLEAIRQGDDKRILELYTAKAREEASTLGEHFAPRGSDTAKFEVGNVEYLDANSARVSAIWTDLDENGKPQSDEALWMVRKEEGGWRVAAMAVKVFDGDEYLFLDFEDLNRTKAMLEEFHKEQLRRAAEMATRPDPATQQR